MKVMHVVGARPNFMKIAPIVAEMGQYPEHFEQLLVHTGQHYDANMSKVFFDELGMPAPDVNLEVGSGSHAWQTAQIMQRIEPVIQAFQPAWVVLPGDVNSTLACALVASKMGVKIAHVEAGLRSFDRTMPEEINRLLTDQISDLLLTPSRDADRNLVREGIAADKIHFVGNVMIDTLMRLLPKANQQWPSLRQRLGFSEPFMLVTLHRPSNVDDPERLQAILNALQDSTQEYAVIFPVHPRTRHKISHHNLLIDLSKVQLLEPLGYLDFIALQAHASLVVTDSGGVQEETTFLKVPCLTLRSNTERPVTLEQGTNRLIGDNPSALFGAIQASKEASEEVTIPELWDGRAAHRIIELFLGEFNGASTEQNILKREVI